MNQAYLGIFNVPKAVDTMSQNYSNQAVRTVELRSSYGKVREFKEQLPDQVIVDSHDQGTMNAHCGHHDRYQNVDA